MPAPLAQPRISVLLPAYNAAATLEQSMVSVLRQTFGDFELLVYDDGSTDGTAELVRELARADARVRWIGQERVGLVEALRRLALSARADLLARMDADDVCAPRRLELQKELMDARPDVAICGTLVRCVPEALVEGGMRAYVDWMNSLITPEQHRRDMLVESPLCHPSAMMRRKAYEAVGGYLDDGCPEDYGLWLRLHLAGYLFAKVPRVLLDWTERPDRLTRIDGRYGRQRFLELKVRALRFGPLRHGQAVRIWGAGPTGRALCRALRAVGVSVVAFYDVDPAKIGRQRQGAPVLSHEQLRGGVLGEVLLVAVGARAAREEIRRFLESQGYEDGRDFHCVS